MTTAPGITLTLPPLYTKQRAAFFTDARYGVTEASTKSGKTVGCIAWLVAQAIETGRPGRNYWWVAPTYHVAKIAYSRLKRMVMKANPQGDLFSTNESELWVEFVNGARIWFKGADKPDTLYGEDVYAAVIDEASRCKEDAWHAVRSTLTFTRGPVRIIGNVKGRKNWAYQMGRKAESGEPDMHYAKITAYDAVEAGVLDAEEIEDARRQLPDAVFRELYLAEPSDDAGNPFGIKAIRDCVAAPSLSPAACYGVDLAKSQDWTWVVGLDAGGHQCVSERWQSDWGGTRRRIIELVGDTRALIDSTGVGDPIVEDLQRELPGVESFKFTAPSKQQLMEGLASAIQRQTVRVYDSMLVSELEQFEYEYTRTGVRYCLDPATRILASDLRWKELGTVAVDDALLSFEEYPSVRRRSRMWREAIVTDTQIIQRPCYRLKLDDGTQLVASAEHLWLVDTGQGVPEWRTTERLRATHPTSHSKRFVPSRLFRALNVWESATSYEAGYLAGVFDGEGSLSQSPRSGRAGQFAFRLSFAQRQNGLAEYARECMRLYGYEWSEANGSGTNGDVCGFHITGRQPELLRLIGQIRPKRLLSKFDGNKLGSIYKLSTPSVVEKEFVGERPVVALGTTTKTLIAEGLLTHNSAPSGLHDDGVCALALAVRQLSAPSYEPVVVGISVAATSRVRGDDWSDDPNIWR